MIRRLEAAIDGVTIHLIQEQGLMGPMDLNQFRSELQRHGFNPAKGEDEGECFGYFGDRHGDQRHRWLITWSADGWTVAKLPERQLENCTRGLWGLTLPRLAAIVTSGGQGSGGTLRSALWKMPATGAVWAARRFWWNLKK